MKHCRCLSDGFTLAELLIALSILGLISAFTIPKILASQQDQQKKSVFKETISSINAIMYAGLSNGAIQNGANVMTAMNTQLNAVKSCDTNATAQGCWSVSQDNASVGSESTQAGALLHNGANVVGFSNSGDADAIVIDWNGNNGPNAYGDDQIKLILCFNTGPNCVGWTHASYTGKIAIGTVSPAQGNTDLALWGWIFQ